VVVNPVPDNCTVVGVPAEIVRREGKRVSEDEAMLDHADLPDPVLQLKKRLGDLQKEVDFLEKQVAQTKKPKQSN